MKDADRAIVAAAEERDRQYRAYWNLETETRPEEGDGQLGDDRRELLRIVREQDALLRERDTLAEDLADDAAAERATSGKWGA